MSWPLPTRGGSSVAVGASPMLPRTPPATPPSTPPSTPSSSSSGGSSSTLGWMIWFGLGWTMASGFLTLVGVDFFLGGGGGGGGGALAAMKATLTVGGVSSSTAQKEWMVKMARRRRCRASDPAYVIRRHFLGTALPWCRKASKLMDGSY